MTAHATHRDVTYIGKENPFVDRNYGSSLEFVPGQTRTVPAALAMRFLAHTDCFKEASAAEKKAAPAKTDKTVDTDTQKKLDDQKKVEDEQRRKDEQVLDMHQQIDSMTKKDVAEFMLTHFKEKADMAKPKADLQTLAKELVSKFGVA